MEKTEEDWQKWIEDGVTKGARAYVEELKEDYANLKKKMASLDLILTVEISDRNAPRRYQPVQEKKPRPSFYSADYGRH